MSRIAALYRGVGAAFLVLAACPARAYFIKPQVKQTFGSQSYYGTYTAVDFGNDLHFKPYFNTYTSHVSSGTYNTYALRGAYEFETAGLALWGGFTPTVNNYSNRFAGGEFSLSFDFDDGTGDKKAEAGDLGPASRLRPRGVSHLDIGAGVTGIVHRELVFLPAVVVGGFNVPASSATTDISQTDVNGNVAVTAWDILASLDVTKSVYNKDLAKMGARAAQVNFLSGLNATILGYPDLNVSGQLEYDGWKSWSPYAGYTYTQYKVTQPIASTYTAGVYVDLPKSIMLDASFQRYSQKGRSSLNYFTLGARARF